MIWSYISALGGLNVTVLVGLAIAAWLVGARCWRLSLAWCVLFGVALAAAVASQVAFIGWGIGVRPLDFTGFSGHATRAAAVYPVAAFLLLERRPLWLRIAGVACAVLLAALVAGARIKIGAHSVSEAVAGFCLGLGAAMLFIRLAHANRRGAPKPLLIALALAMLLLPSAEPPNTHQWVTALALALAHQDRPYLRGSWKPAGSPYVPPCEPERVRFGYVCT
ncbi:phosphatase PAP2 family protein [Massilia horti]|uniref:Phosphatase PAP2 family protein n=1 Tax=Massilia horti TaxID=2562153 RepID=A0A4Y9T512_9BURK|nr:phosphatase PAP2 family protein [Massilia horti]TFW33001.1 phosphatase PAP2 family protein [Massilia horti]